MWWKQICGCFVKNPQDQSSLKKTEIVNVQKAVVKASPKGDANFDDEKSSQSIDFDRKEFHESPPPIHRRSRWTTCDRSIEFEGSEYASPASPATNLDLSDGCLMYQTSTVVDNFYQVDDDDSASLLNENLSVKTNSSPSISNFVSMESLEEGVITAKPDPKYKLLDTVSSNSSNLNEALMPRNFVQQIALIEYEDKIKLLMNDHTVSDSVYASPVGSAYIECQDVIQNTIISCNISPPITNVTNIDSAANFSLEKCRKESLIGEPLEFFRSSNYDDYAQNKNILKVDIFNDNDMPIEQIPIVNTDEFENANKFSENCLNESVYHSPVQTIDDFEFLNKALADTTADTKLIEKTHSSQSLCLKNNTSILNSSPSIPREIPAVSRAHWSCPDDKEDIVCQQRTEFDEISKNSLSMSPNQIDSLYDFDDVIPNQNTFPEIDESPLSKLVFARSSNSITSKVKQPEIIETFSYDNNIPNSYNCHANRINVDATNIDMFLNSMNEKKYHISRDNSVCSQLPSNFRIHQKFQRISSAPSSPAVNGKTLARFKRDVNLLLVKQVRENGLHSAIAKLYQRSLQNIYKGSEF